MLTAALFILGGLALSNKKEQATGTWNNMDESLENYAE